MAESIAHRDATAGRLAGSAGLARPPGIATVPAWPPASPVTIAVDAGTTGVRALVVDERARVVDVAYRELDPVLPATGLGRARRRRDLGLVRSTLAEVAGRLADQRPGGPGHRHHQPAGDGRGLGPAHRRPAPPGHRLAGPPHRRRAAGPADRGRPPPAGPRERTGLVLDPYFSATKMQWLLDQGGLSTGPRTWPSAPSTPGCCGT